ncbi:MAG: hypothetical protein RL562_4, partial [Planctomycetota bacterium]
KDGSPIQKPQDVMRSTDDEKDRQIAALEAFRARNRDAAPAALAMLQSAALAGGNIFAALMEAAKSCSLGQISQTLYEVGGQYRRNM